MEQHQDRLEQFIHHRRAEFDTASPRADLWFAIEQKLGPAQAAPTVTRGRHVWLWKPLRIAAAVLLLLSAGAGGGIWWVKNQSAAPVAGLRQNNGEIAEVEQYYSREVRNKMAQLASYQYDNSVKDDLQQLDGFLEELKQELANTPPASREQVVNVMIENYQAKLEILDKVLYYLQNNTTNNNQQNQADRHEKKEI